MSRMSAGNLFQASGAAVENDLDPKAVREREMSKWPRSADHRCDRPGRCETGKDHLDFTYSGACPCTTPCIRQHSLYVIR